MSSTENKDLLDQKESELESLKYESMFERLETIVDDLSSKDTMDLDSVVSSIEEGYKLIEVMKERLAQAKDKVEMIKKLNILDDDNDNQAENEEDDDSEC